MYRFPCLGLAAATLALADRHRLAAGQRAAGDRHPRSAERGHALAEGVDLAGGDVARQLHHVRRELAQRHLALVVTDDDVVDRGVADDPRDLLLLLGEQSAHPVRGALADEDDPGPAEHPGAGPRRGGPGAPGGAPPVTAHALEPPRRGARLTLHLPV